MLLRFCLISCVALVHTAAHNSKRQLFKAAAKPVDVSNAHAFIAPGASDLRGPCPALNALANHGYIARNGYTNFQESLNAVIQVYGAGESSSSGAVYPKPWLTEFPAQG